jgi:isopentenyl-diphosphate delta-isomerase
MKKTAFSSEIEKRKKEHLRIAVSEASQTGDNGLSDYRFIHNAIPEMDFDKIDTSTAFLDKKVSYPFFISCMTGGILEGGKLNQNLAKAAEKYKIAFGVGSQRAAVEHSELERFFEVRKHAPNIPLLANIGLVQLNYGFGAAEFQKCVDMVEADALVVHINPIQEVVQPGGDRNWENLVSKLAHIIKKIKTPVIVKEVGCGLSPDVIKRLYDIGVKMFDTAGWGGTSWPKVEGLRGESDLSIGELFGEWGIPTAETIKTASAFKENHKDVTVLGSGGIRNGVEIAKCMALGADLVGIAAPFAKAGIKSQEEVERQIEKYARELKISMFGVGAKDINQLKEAKLQTLN